MKLYTFSFYFYFFENEKFGFMLFYTVSDNEIMEKMS